MNTKIFSVLITSILMLSLMGTFVLADDDGSELEDNSDSGLSTAEMNVATADENAESSSGILSDKFKMVFANKGEKAKIKMDIANKRMNEIKKAENNPDKAKKLAEQYEKDLDSALESFNQIAVDGDEKQVLHALKQTVIMKYRLETHGEKVSEVHARILIKQSEKMNEEQIAHLTEVFGNINEKVVSKISEIGERQESLIARAVVVTGLTEEEIRTKLENFEASLAEKKQLRDERFKEKIKAELKANGELRNKFEFETNGLKQKIEVRTDSDGNSKFKTETEAIELN